MDETGKTHRSELSDSRRLMILLCYGLRVQCQFVDNATTEARLAPGEVTRNDSTENAEYGANDRVAESLVRCRIDSAEA